MGSQLRIAGCLSKSTDVMKSMQQLVKMPEIQKTMMEMSKEMMKAGIIEEMMEDTMESMEPEDLDEDIQLEVDKVLSELTADKSAAQDKHGKTRFNTITRSTRSYCKRRRNSRRRGRGG